MARLAFVFGSNGSDAFGRLKYAETDATKMRSVLEGPRYQFNVVKPETSDPYEVRRRLDATVSACARGDTFICYFAGHGALDDGELFLIVEGSTRDFATTAVPAEAVVSAMRRCKARDKLLILDCCHAGGAVAGGRDVAIPIEELRLASGSHLLLMASGRLEQAREDDSVEGGVLTAALVDAMDRSFHEVDKDKDLQLTLDEVLVWVNHVVAARGDVPIPRLLGEQQGRFILTAAVAERERYETDLPDGSTLVILPCAPVDAMGGRFSRQFRRFADSYGQGDDAVFARYAVAIGKFPITNAQYRRFLQSSKGQLDEPIGEFLDGKKWRKRFQPWRDARFSSDDLPVTCVSFSDAVEYCTWVESLNTRGCFVDVQPFRFRDFAAFGTEFPSEDPSTWKDMLGLAWHKQLSPAPIDRSGKRSKNAGATDLFGNIWEWCGTTYGLLRRRAVHAPPFQNAYKLQVARWAENVRLRGGSFLCDLETSIPFFPTDKLPKGIDTRRCDIGFRLGALVPLEALPESLVQALELQRPLNLSMDIENLSQVNEWAEFDF